MAGLCTLSAPWLGPGVPDKTKFMQRLNMNWLTCFMVIAGNILFMPHAWSQQGPTPSLATPSTRIILTMSGSIANINHGGAAQFDSAMIDSLPVYSIKTSTPWYKQPMTFSGPRLSDLLAVVGAKGVVLEIKALNDYKVDVPFTDAAQLQPILARKMDGKPLSVRDKGPLFLVYPFDARPELKNDIYYGRSIWQISNIVVR